MRNVLLVVVLLFVLLIGGCFAILGAGLDAADEAIKAEEANDKPKEVAEGKAFTHDDYAVDAGWTVAKDATGGVTIKNARVTNDADEGRTALLTFTFYKGSENLAEVECSSNELQAGESSKLDCVSFDSDFPTGYKTIKVADAF
ncbi:hypothetical protein [Nocardioides sp. zg-1230]|uniref:hypothetical protein n=1 Tax=Nocardioides sp. zg-1230 TaxID=2736601 RepID=UPI001555D9EC|nr:hypothetical protein [Nocardioides sp. zg-1230]NPC45122.1 hypothetical protein [Nocardioides sp. zg-1230]